MAAPRPSMKFRDPFAGQRKPLTTRLVFVCPTHGPMSEDKCPCDNTTVPPTSELRWEPKIYANPFTTTSTLPDNTLWQVNPAPEPPLVEWEDENP